MNGAARTSETYHGYIMLKGFLATRTPKKKLLSRNAREPFRNPLGIPAGSEWGAENKSIESQFCSSGRFLRRLASNRSSSWRDLLLRNRFPLGRAAIIDFTSSNPAAFPVCSVNRPEGANDRSRDRETSTPDIDEPFPRVTRAEM